MSRQMIMRLHTEDLVVDSFAGGGGASLGIEWALGRSPDIAINHDGAAVAMHAENHPATKHYCENIWEVDPVEAVSGKRVALAWFSPDCKHFSKAKGGKPVDQKIRSLAWVVVRWAKAVRPRVICVENVEEFKTWGPLGDDGRPCKARSGQTFRRWVAALERLGYQVEVRELRACDYGAPTTRKRLFVIARCDGRVIAWPTPTHGDAPGLAPYRTAATIIDWSVPCTSIFERERPLAEKTLARIARGVQKFVIDAASPFTVDMAGTPGADRALAVPYLVHVSNGERQGQAPRIYDPRRPLGTVVAQGVKHAACVAWLVKHYGGNESSSGGTELNNPIDTVTATDHHALTVAFLARYNGTGEAESLDKPLGTVTSRDRFALARVTIDGETYAIVDIGMRMLTPRELYRAQGFPDSYLIDFAVKGKPLSKTAQIRMAGNSVCPPVAAAIVSVNAEITTSTARVKPQLNLRA